MSTVDTTRTEAISLADEPAVKKVLIDSVLGLWDVVNNLTRLKPSEQDRYRCPAGNYLYYHNFKKEDQLIAYQIEDVALCAGCALRSQCTQSKTGRTVTRPIFTELVEAGRAQARSQAARRDWKRRKHIMEGSFADASNNHGFKRARWRGLWRQQIQDWIIAAVQNLRILLKMSGWRRSGVPLGTLFVMH